METNAYVLFSTDTDTIPDFQMFILSELFAIDTAEIAHRKREVRLRDAAPSAQGHGGTLMSATLKIQPPSKP
jgi:hypothetical protein